METNAVFAIVVVVSLFAFVLLLRKKKAGGVSRRVDNYALSVEDRNGFPFVRLKLQTEDGAFDTFELDPNYSHVLSDELLQTSVKALRTGHAPQK